MVDKVMCLLSQYNSTLVNNTHVLDCYPIEVNTMRLMCLSQNSFLLSTPKHPPSSNLILRMRILKQWVSVGDECCCCFWGIIMAIVWIGGNIGSWFRVEWYSGIPSMPISPLESRQPPGHLPHLRQEMANSNPADPTPHISPIIVCRMVKTCLNNSEFTTVSLIEYSRIADTGRGSHLTSQW